MDSSAILFRVTLYVCLYLAGVDALQIPSECGTAKYRGLTPQPSPFPWFVGVYMRTRNGMYEQICGGTLVSPDLVISAAHCFYNELVESVQNASKFTIVGGKFYRSYEGPEAHVQESSFESIGLSERYIGPIGNYAHDIALVRLETPFNVTELVRPVCVDLDNRYENEQFQSGKIGKVFGWGVTETGEPSETLKEMNLPYVPYEECSAAVPEDFRAVVSTSDKFCAGSSNGSSVCKGDGGGGLCFQRDGRWYLRGILSAVPTGSIDFPCDNAKYAALTNVGHFIQWIRDAISSKE